MFNARSIQRMGLTVGALLSLSGSTTARPTHPVPKPIVTETLAPDARTVAAFAASINPVPCPYGCIGCMAGWLNEVVAITNGNLADGPVDCGFYYCPNPITQCDANEDQGASLLTAEDYGRLLQLVASGDDAKLRRFVNAHPGLQVNTERHSLQARGCGGSTVTNIPLTDSQIAELGH